MQRDHERACYMAAELFCTDGEWPSLVAHLINHYARRRCSSSLPTAIDIDEQIALLCDRIHALKRVHAVANKALANKKSSSMSIIRRSVAAAAPAEYAAAHDDADVDDADLLAVSRDRPWMDAQCRRLMCGLTMRISLLDLKHEAQADAATALTYAHSGPRKPSERARSAIQALLADGGVDADILPVLQRLAAMTLCDAPSPSSSDVKNILSSIVCILRVHPSLGAEEQPSAWSELRDVRPSLRRSTAWVLWKLAAHIAELLNSASLQRYVATSLRMYKRFLLKTNMSQRTNLLLCAYSCLARRGVRRSSPSYMDVASCVSMLQNADQRADILFDDVICRAGGDDGYVEEHEQLLRSLQRQHDDAREKMKLLHCITYVDPSRKEEIDADRAVGSPHVSDQANIKHVVLEDAASEHADQSLVPRSSHHAVSRASTVLRQWPAPRQ